jgi:hypothetical protein
LWVADLWKSDEVLQVEFLRYMHGAVSNGGWKGKTANHVVTVWKSKGGPMRVWTHFIRMRTQVQLYTSRLNTLRKDDDPEGVKHLYKTGVQIEQDLLFLDSHSVSVWNLLSRSDASTTLVPQLRVKYNSYAKGLADIRQKLERAAENVASFAKMLHWDVSNKACTPFVSLMPMR